MRDGASGTVDKLEKNRMEVVEAVDLGAWIKRHIQPRVWDAKLGVGKVQPGNYSSGGGGASLCACQYWDVPVGRRRRRTGADENGQ